MHGKGGSFSAFRILWNQPSPENPSKKLRRANDFWKFWQWIDETHCFTASTTGGQIARRHFYKPKFSNFSSWPYYFMNVLCEFQASFPNTGHFKCCASSFKLILCSVISCKLPGWSLFMLPWVVMLTRALLLGKQIAIPCWDRLNWRHIQYGQLVTW